MKSSDGGLVMQPSFADQIYGFSDEYENWKNERVAKLPYVSQSMSG